jgi:hypothetical protein
LVNLPAASTHLGTFAPKFLDMNFEHCLGVKFAHGFVQQRNLPQCSANASRRAGMRVVQDGRYFSDGFSLDPNG